MSAPMPPVEGFSRVVTASVASGILSGASGVVLADDNIYRRYLANIGSSCRMNGVLDASSKGIVYNVGRRGGAGTGLERHSVAVQRYSCAVAETAAYQADLSGSARRSSAYPAVWPMFEMAGVVERLASGMAHYANHGALTVEQLRGGGAASLLALDAATEPIAASGTHVYVPALVETSITSGIMAALLNAVSGEGGTLVTDLVALQPRDNAVQEPTADGEALAVGCYHALELLGSNYIARGAGSVFAYALTRGIHRGVKVTGHTDEGAITRDLLRRGGFAVPSGGILSNLPTYTGMRKPSGGLKSFQALVDGIALSTAGAVAACDPLVENAGKMFPTVLTASGAKRENQGCHEKGTEDDGRSIMSQLAVEAPRFAELYSVALEDIFCVTGMSHIVKRHFIAVVNTMVGTSPRHLRHKVVAPWFWVEPTGVYDGMIGKSPAVAEGYAQLCGVYRENHLPFFSGYKNIGVFAAGSSAVVDWRSARKHGLVHHLTLHQLDGLANIKPRQMDPGRCALVGAGREGFQDERVETRMRRGADLSEYTWGRGHSAVVAPAEFIVTGSVALSFAHAIIGEDELRLERTHCPSAAELEIGGVDFSVTSPMALPNGALRATPRGVSRARTRATEALAIARAGLAPAHGSGDIGVSFVDPSITQSVRAPDDATRVPSTGAGPSGAIGVASTCGIRRTVTGQAAPPGLARTPGNRVAPVVLAGAAKGPRLMGSRQVAATPRSGTEVVTDEVGELDEAGGAENTLSTEAPPPEPSIVPAAEAQ